MTENTGKTRNKDSAKKAKGSENTGETPEIHQGQPENTGESVKPKIGRPPGSGSLFTQEIADSICHQISEGIPLREICRQEGMPCVTTVNEWKTVHPDFGASIARAREKGFDAIAEECLDIADNASNDWMERHDQDGEKTIGWQINGDHVQRSKLRIETRLKLLAKWDPKRYGDKLQVGGASDLPPIQSNVTVDAAEAYKLMLSKPDE